MSNFSLHKAVYDHAVNVLHKRPRHIEQVSVFPNGDGRSKGEIVINAHGTRYVRVVQVGNGGQIKDVTMRTRLDVPISDIPINAEVRIPGSTTVYRLCSKEDGIAALCAGDGDSHIVMSADDRAEVEFYMSDEGMHVGGVIIKTKDVMECLANGCKFEAMHLGTKTVEYIEKKNRESAAS